MGVKVLARQKCGSRLVSVHIESRPFALEKNWLALGDAVSPCPGRFFQMSKHQNIQQNLKYVQYIFSRGKEGTLLLDSPPAVWQGVLTSQTGLQLLPCCVAAGKSGAVQGRQAPALEVSPRTAPGCAALGRRPCPREPWVHQWSPVLASENPFLF